MHGVVIFILDKQMILYLYNNCYVDSLYVQLYFIVPNNKIANKKHVRKQSHRNIMSYNTRRMW